MNDRPDVCIVTHPITDIGDLAVTGLLDLVSAACGSVHLVTANLPLDSDVRTEYSYTEISSSGMGRSVVVAAIRFLMNQLRMTYEITRREEEVVLFFGASSYLLPILVSRVLGKKVVVEPRGNVPDALYGKWRERMPDILAYIFTLPVRGLERAGFVLADKIITLSPAMSEDLDLEKHSEKLHEDGARPVDVDRFSVDVLYEDRPNLIGYIGRLDEEKGVDILTDVIKKMDIEEKFVFVGGGYLQDEVEERLSEEIDRDEVEVTGWVEHEEVPKHLNKLRLMVSTSRTEGVPTTALESMACGTPVCATSVGGVPDVVKEGETGYLLEPDGTPEQFAEKIENVVQKQDELREMSDVCRSFVVDNYSFEVVVEKYRVVFQDLCR